jgi:hypothetical protein
LAWLAASRVIVSGQVLAASPRQATSPATASVTTVSTAASP